MDFIKFLTLRVDSLFLHKSLLSPLCKLDIYFLISVHNTYSWGEGAFPLFFLCLSLSVVGGPDYDRQGRSGAMEQVICKTATTDCRFPSGRM